MLVEVLYFQNKNCNFNVKILRNRESLFNKFSSLQLKNSKKKEIAYCHIPKVNFQRYMVIFLSPKHYRCQLSRHVFFMIKTTLDLINRNRIDFSPLPTPTHPPHLPTYLPTHLPTYPPTHQPKKPKHLPTHPPTPKPTYLPQNPPTILPTHPPACLSTYLPTYLLTFFLSFY